MSCLPGVVFSCVLAAWWPLKARADIAADTTRVILPMAAREASINIYNGNDYPVLIQSWVDDGDIGASPDTLDVPLLVLPPLARLAPGEARALRIINTKPTEEGEQESLLWFNVQEVPPMVAGDQGGHTLAISVRLRMKIFLRPQKLRAEDLAWIDRLECKLRPDGSAVECLNPSPCYATIAAFTARDAGGAALRIQGETLPPFGHASFSWHNAAVVPQSVRAVVIDDDGWLRERAL